MMRNISIILLLTATFQLDVKSEFYMDASGAQFEKAQIFTDESLERVERGDSESKNDEEYSEDDDGDDEDEEEENMAEGEEEDEEGSEDVTEPRSRRKEIKDFSSSNNSEVGKEGTVNLTKNLPPCAEDQVIQLMKELHAINPEGVVIRATESDTVRLCRKLTTGVSNIDHFMTTCDPSKDGKLYAQLIRGVRTLSEKLCEEEEFQKDFLHYSDCYRKLREDYKDCLGSPGWSESADPEKLCDSYMKISNCFYIKTAVLCGKNGARVMKELLKFVVGSMLTEQCKGIDQDPDLSGLAIAAGTPAYKQRNMWSFGPYVNILLYLMRSHE